MNSIIMNVSKVLETVKENRKTHKEDFILALNGYKIKSEEKFRKYTKQFKQNLLDFDIEPKNLQVSLGSFNLPIFPENHLAEYDRVIKMLEMTTQKEIELDHKEFSNYIMDNWDWKNSFKTIVSGYASVPLTNDFKAQKVNSN